MEHKKSLEQFEHEQDVKLKQQYNATHHARKEDHHHETFSGISYSEYNCMKLNGYRADDRPYGREDRRRWKLFGMLGDETYSEEKAKTWIASGKEVREYNAKGELTKVHNPSKGRLDQIKRWNIQMA